MPVWKTISLGTYPSVEALRDALASDSCAYRPHKVGERAPHSPSVPGCYVGGRANEIISHPAFNLSQLEHEIDLVIAEVTDLGFGAAENVALEDIYTNADRLGLTLCPAEVGPQLRLQYLDQQVGEFLRVAMQPVATFAGEPTYFTVGNGGAGLVLLGVDGRPTFTLPAVSRFVFARPRPQPYRAPSWQLSP
jgi:hypothetical protein